MSTSDVPHSDAPTRGTNLAVLVSGAGTIMEAMIKQGLPVELVLADRPCRALDIAEAAGVAIALVDRETFGWPAASWDRSAFTAAVIAQLHAHHVGLIAMSGFMTLLSPAIFSEFEGHILNTHPSLLPAFKGHGDRVITDTLAAGVTETGCSVQIATYDLDAGPVIAQERVPVLPGDTKDTLWERIKVTERKLYPRIIREQLHALTKQ
jgi:phosphoribosylglycinamide formyltransferase 1